MQSTYLRALVEIRLGDLVMENNFENYRNPNHTMTLVLLGCYLGITGSCMFWVKRSDTSYSSNVIISLQSIGCATETNGSVAIGLIMEWALLLWMAVKSKWHDYPFV